jgi:hypothetical protein
MAACLAGKSISASLSNQDDGQTHLSIDLPHGGPSPKAFVWVMADGSSSQLTDDEESNELVEAAVAEGRSLLWLEGVDRTADYDACAAETQFAQPSLFADPAAELRVKQLQTDLNNDFAACARANGFPEIEDQPPPDLDGGATTAPPAIELPWRITEEELRDLLDRCPTYDEARLRELADGESDGTHWLEEEILGPSLTIGVSGRDSPDGVVSDEDFPRWESLEKTKAEIANSQLAEFIERLAAEGITYLGPQPEAGFNWAGVNQ